MPSNSKQTHYRRLLLLRPAKASGSLLYTSVASRLEYFTSDVSFSASTTIVMDLESYSARYSGETRLQRVLLIARTTPNDALASQAFDMAEQLMKADGNVKRYKEVFGYQQQEQQTTSEGGGEQEQPQISSVGE
jgi:hypothetical protein